LTLLADKIKNDWTGKTIFINPDVTVDEVWWLI
jgi:hypothetical protein